MKIYWNDFFWGFALASVLAMLFIKLTWAPLVGKSFEVSSKALAATIQSQEMTMQYKSYTGSLYFALCEARDLEPDPFMVEFFAPVEDEPTDLTAQGREE